MNDSNLHQQTPTNNGDGHHGTNTNTTIQPGDTKTKNLSSTGTSKELTCIQEERENGSTSIGNYYNNNKYDDSGANNCNDDDDSFNSYLSSSVTSQQATDRGLGKNKNGKGTTAPGGNTLHSNWIRRSKFLVFMVLLVAAVSSSIVVFRASTNVEDETYNTRFQDIATSIFAVAEINAGSVVRTYEDLSRQMTAYTTASVTKKGSAERGWPFVTIPNFEAIADPIIRNTETTALSLSNFVSKDQFSEYTQYKMMNREWVQEGLDYLGDNSSLFTSPIVFDQVDLSAGEFIPSTLDSVEDSEGFAILSQLAPVNLVGQLTNLNVYSDTYSNWLYKNAIESQSTVFSYVINPDEEITSEINWPASFMVTPVFDKLLPTTPSTQQSTDASDRKVVGMIAGNVRWQGYFRDLVPDSIDEIYLVVKNSGCGQSFTYLIDGPNVHYIGKGDVSEDPNLQQNEFGSPPVLDMKESAPFSAFTSLDVCSYSLHLYPSQSFYDTYHTEQPIFNTVTILATFLLTAVVFLVYDCLVEQRQMYVMRTTQRSDAIINSMFPANIRDRLMNDGRSDTSVETGFMHNNSKAMNPPQGQFGQQSQKRKLKKYFYHPHDQSNASSSTENDVSSDGRDRKVGRWFSLAGSSQKVPANISRMERATTFHVHDSKPIADFFPETSIVFADIVGFTAWSSMREPAQVFTLLESVYSSFDKIAMQLGVFKVETIGDCYVAACGVPEPRDDATVVIAKFARRCMNKMADVVRNLTVVLGPNTRDLTIRVGIHSGPITAGVLRGARSRFQLFGSTVNVASRIESTSLPGKIQLSQEAADKLAAADKRSWFVARSDKVFAKGLGEMQTYWLVQRSGDAGSVTVSAVVPAATDGSSEANQINGIMAPKQENAKSPARRGLFNRQASSRHATGGMQANSGKNATSTTSPSIVAANAAELSNGHADPANAQHAHSNNKSRRNSIDNIRNDDNDRTNNSSKKLANLDMDLEIQWNADVLQTMIKKIVAMRDPRKRVDKQALHRLDVSSKSSADADGTVLDEVREVIELPFEASKYQIKPEAIVLSPVVVNQIEDYVRQISEMYRGNPFHNFSHAAHVVQSTIKLLSRIIRSDAIDYEGMCYKERSGEVLHKYTYGITSDPITQFACVLAALVHDVDHVGLPNSQLVKEKTRMAIVYKNKSVAECNSLDLAWDLLMEPRFAELRACIYSTQEELDRFRQLLVNAVLATDIMDKELGALRKLRWQTAFDRRRNTAPSLSASFGSVGASGADASSQPVFDNKEDSNRMATIVIEHLIQASDVSHTMQHWHVYVKWNERLFDEMYKAYCEGRAEKDPSEGWYEGELGFFDFYIIPLAKKLKECGVFGVSSDEYLNYAVTNRKEWEVRGKEVVAGYLSKHAGSSAP